MERDDIARWMRAYRDAWSSSEPSAIAALFTERAVYSPDPFEPPWAGRDEIVRRWRAGISQQVDLTFEVLANSPEVAIVHWHGFTRNVNDPVRTEYDGVLEIAFADDGRCRRLREWYSSRERH
jgi:ketosteroid isomerase-like protein